MEVGLDDSLQLEFEYPRSVYSLDDVVTGWVSFALVRIRVRSVELSIVKKEFVGENAIDGQETMARWEMLEGDVHRGTEPACY